MADMTLRAARRKAGLSKRGLADSIGRNRMTIARLESNENTPLPETVLKLEAALSAVIGEPITLRFPRQRRRAA